MLDIDLFQKSFVNIGYADPLSDDMEKSPIALQQSKIQADHPGVYGRLETWLSDRAPDRSASVAYKANHTASHLIFRGTTGPEMINPPEDLLQWCKDACHYIDETADNTAKSARPSD